MDRKGCEGTGTQGVILTDTGTLREAVINLFYVPATAVSCINDGLKELDNHETDFFGACFMS